MTEAEQILALARKILADHERHCIDVDNRWLPDAQAARLKADTDGVALARMIIGEAT